MLDEREDVEASRTAEHLAVAIEAPPLGLEDPGAWLQTAKRLQKVWLMLCEDKGFAHQIFRLRMFTEPEFSIGGLELLAKIERASRYRRSLIKICLADQEAQEIVIFVAAGLLKLVNGRYQLAVPCDIDMGAVRVACLALAATEDEEYVLHPEALVMAVPMQSSFRWCH